MTTSIRFNRDPKNAGYSVQDRVALKDEYDGFPSIGSDERPDI